ncbi:hypothetical protein PtB15_14B233 [Puccinia triticina]|nr:hypothetical protein PtB15_14B233 [Puccinia triticina]
MEESPHSEVAQALAFRESVRRASKKDLYLTLQAKVFSFKEMVARAQAYQDTVDHPRLWTLRSQYHGAPQKNLGTPPAPRPDAHGPLPPRPPAPVPHEQQASPAFNYLVDAMSRLI